MPWGDLWIRLNEKKHLLDTDKPRDTFTRIKNWSPKYLKNWNFLLKQNKGEFFNRYFQISSFYQNCFIVKLKNQNELFIVQYWVDQAYDYIKIIDIYLYRFWIEFLDLWRGCAKRIKRQLRKTTFLKSQILQRRFRIQIWAKIC